MVVIVRGQDDLVRLLQRESVLHPFRKPRVQIRVIGLSGPDAAAWEARLEHMRQQCGCTAGAIAMALFAVGFVAYALGADAATPASLWPQVMVQCVLLTGGLIGSALLGKMFGLYLERLRYESACLALRRQLSLVSQSAPRVDRVQVEFAAPPPGR